MKKRKFMAYAFAAILLSGFAACSDNDEPSQEPEKPGTEEPEKPGTEEPETPSYVWGTDTDGKKTVDHLLFDSNAQEAPEGTIIGNGEKELVFKGKQTLKKGVYTLKGWIYIASGSELTIEAGTVIKGDKETQASLIVEPGAKLFAQGKQDAPIVFTSAQPKGQRKPGDWGGLILCGNAKNNQGTQQIEGGPRTKHGGDNDADNSGVLSYVRVEFAGYPFQKDKEINGITFGSVGSGTQIDHLQVSFSNDDSYEWFGGSVNAKYLVAFNGWDDDFDTDNGFSGKVQYGLVVRHPRIADTSQSNGFESDNCADGAEVAPFTTATFSNITFVGPKSYDGFENNTDYINGGDFYPNNGSSLGKFQSAMHIRRSSHLSCFNSVAVGYPVGLILDGEKGNTVQFAKDGQLKLQNIIFAGMTATGTDANKKYEDELLTGYNEEKKAEYDATQPSFSTTFFLAQPGNQVFPTIAELLLTDSRHIGAAYVPQAGSPLLTAAAWTDAALAEGFDKVSYAGAFDTTDSWLEGWTNFDPNQTEY